jgi:hypothetical protein
MTRSELHRLVDEFPDEQVDSAAQLLEVYIRGDRFMIQHLTVPEDDPTPDELAALAELTNEDLDSTNAIPAEEVRRHLPSNDET